MASARDLAGLLTQAAERAPECGVVTVGEPQGPTRLDYPRLLGLARAVAARLRRLGCAAGQRVLLFGIDLPDFFPALWACLIGGLVPLPVAADETTPSATAGRMLDAWRRLGEPPVLAGQAGAAALAAAGPPAGRPRLWLPDDWAASDPLQDAEDIRRAPPGPGQPALLLLSSGSTGATKIIPLTHEGLLDFAAGTQQVLGWLPGETTLNWLPVDHSASLLLYHLLAAFTGCTNVHVPTGQVLADPLRWFDLIAEHRVCHTWARRSAIRWCARLSPPRQVSPGTCPACALWSAAVS